MLRFFALSLVFPLVACTGSSDDDDDGTDSADTSGGSDSPVDTGPQLPTDPRPVTVTLGGGYTGTIEFDTPTCTNYPQGSLVSFRQFWRGSSHNAVLIADVIGNFAGAGTYNTTDHNLRVLLQSDSSSTTYNFSFSADTGQGDSATMTIDHISDIAWGEFQATHLHGQVDGTVVTDAVTINGPLPIYCPAVTSQ
ncbi:MAG: hypothetical protein KC912_18235 [Proteobacteria bacterium]|nr:hypothetical protein [Pseudomonadota bacterium]